MQLTNIKYKSDYSGIQLDIQGPGTLNIKYMLEDDTEYISLDPITISETTLTTKLLLASTDLKKTVDGVVTFPFSAGLVDGIYSFELTDGVDTLTEVRLFSRNVKISIYRILSVLRVDSSMFEHQALSEIYHMYIVYKGLIYNAVIGQEQKTLTELKALRTKCQSLMTTLGL